MATTTFAHCAPRGSAAGRAAAATRFTAGLFSRAGYNVLAIDLLHFGDRRTGLLETFSEAKKHQQPAPEAQAGIIAWLRAHLP